MARKKIIAGNWKMNMTPSEAVELVNTLKPLVATEDADVVFCKRFQYPGWCREHVLRGERCLHWRDFPEHAD